MIAHRVAHAIHSAPWREAPTPHWTPSGACDSKGTEAIKPPPKRQHRADLKGTEAIKVPQRELQNLYREWKDLGEPRGKGGRSNRGGGARGQRGFFTPGPFLRTNLILFITTYSPELGASEQSEIDERAERRSQIQCRAQRRSGTRKARY